MARQGSSAGSHRLMSAEVILRPPAGADAAAPVTSENLARLRPDPRAAELARRGFAERGFSAGEVIGGSFTVTGPATLFDATFGAGLAGGRAVSGADLTVLVPSMPRHVADTIEAVAPSEAPDFGPPSF